MTVADPVARLPGTPRVGWDTEQQQDAVVDTSDESESSDEPEPDYRTPGHEHVDFVARVRRVPCLGRCAWKVWLTPDCDWLSPMCCR